MDNVVSLYKKFEENRKADARDILCDQADLLIRRMKRVKKHCTKGDRDAFVWSGIMMSYKLLDEMSIEIDKLIDGSFDGGHIDDRECEGKDRVE